MSKRPCAKCQGRGGTTEQIGSDILRVRKCDRCHRFFTDLQAAQWMYRKPRCVRADSGEIAVLVKESNVL
jgi:hypothetical protein